MIQITFSGSVAEVRQHAIELSRVFRGKALPVEKKEQAPVKIPEFKDAECGNSAPMNEVVTANASTHTEPVATPAKRGRKPKVSAPAHVEPLEPTAPSPIPEASKNEPQEEVLANPQTAPTKTTSPEATEKPETTKVTREQLLGALQKVANTHGVAKCRDVLGRYGAQKIGEVPADRWQEFVAHCEETAKTGQA